MDKYTQGEWKKNPYYAWVEAETGRGRIMVANCTGNSAEQDANANLIAAAPAMYQLLKDCLDLCNLRDYQLDDKVKTVLAAIDGEAI